MTGKKSNVEPECLRRVEVRRSLGASRFADRYEHVLLRELKKGDVFRMFEPDDGIDPEGPIQVLWENGQDRSICTGNPYLNYGGVWEVECDPYDETSR